MLGFEFGPNLNRLVAFLTHCFSSCINNEGSSTQCDCESGAPQCQFCYQSSLSQIPSVVITYCTFLHMVLTRRIHPNARTIIFNLPRGSSFWPSSSSRTRGITTATATILLSVLSSSPITLVSAFSFVYPTTPTRFYRRANTCRCPMSSSSSSSSFQYITSADPVPDLPSWMLSERTRILSKGDNDNTADGSNIILYWMQRDVRTQDNWALLLAQHYAQGHKLPLHVVHVLPPPPPTPSDPSTTTQPPPLSEMPMTERYGKFLLDGLKCVHDELGAQSVPFHIVQPSFSDPTEVVKCLFHHLDKQQKMQGTVLKPAVIITDMSPIRHLRQWTESLPSAVCAAKPAHSCCPVYQVDAHNVVPVWYASPKREVGARTLRPKINKLIDDCLQYNDYKKANFIPDFVGNTHLTTNNKNNSNKKKELPLTCPGFEYDIYKKFLKWDESVAAVDDWAKGGTKAGMAQFEQFVKVGLPKFGQLRNDPNQSKICSHLSPWLNFGHISFATLMRQLKTHNRDSEGKASFIEEGLVRRELSDNYLWYTPDDYDQLTGSAGWAQESLELHSSDPREYTYTLEQFINGQTHDDLWNASQIQLTTTGKLHGFLRMYWCKKILEWTTNPAEALAIGQYLNDYYALDGRDPNGFVGIGWSIMGVHDMGWKERDIFGKIRFMNYAGCKRKFKVDEFVAKVRIASAAPLSL
jgi:deoxyribodipyrimidine photo-lyase